MLTGKTLQETRFLWDLSDGSNRKVCLHLKFLRKSAFLLCSWLFKKVLDNFQKNFQANILAFLQGLYQVTYHSFRVGEKMPKSLPILDFGVQH